MRTASRAAMAKASSEPVAKPLVAGMLYAVHRGERNHRSAAVSDLAALDAALSVFCHLPCQIAAVAHDGDARLCGAAEGSMPKEGRRP